MADSSSQTVHDHHEEGGHFVVPFHVLRNTALALFGLTILTVFTAKFVHLGPFASLVAFSIAFVKAMLVISYFMGLAYDSKSNRFIFSLGFIFLALLAFFSVLDIWTRITQDSTLN